MKTIMSVSLAILITAAVQADEDLYERPPYHRGLIDSYDDPQLNKNPAYQASRLAEICASDECQGGLIDSYDCYNPQLHKRLYGQSDGSSYRNRSEADELHSRRPYCLYTCGDIGED